MSEMPREEPVVPFSVVIPAFDEGQVIERCLAFTRDLAPGEAEVVVVANGCSDDTVARAARLPGVQVLDLPAPGKAAALNAGDAAVSHYPRVYLDADVVADATALRAVVRTLSDGHPAVAAPRAHFNLEQRPLLVRLFFSAYQRLSYISKGMVGSGFYALNEEGRARFDVFPTLTADDLFVQRRFGPEEVRVVDDSVFHVEVPHTLRDLVKVRTRIAHGNAQLAAAGLGPYPRTTVETAHGLGRLIVGDVRMIPAATVYAGVTIVSRLMARRRAAARWWRDESTRRASPGAG
jgi:glycosyltransferase involved in cell wall biosynthesis